MEFHDAQCNELVLGTQLVPFLTASMKTSFVLSPVFVGRMPLRSLDFFIIGTLLPQIS